MSNQQRPLSPHLRDILSDRQAELDARQRQAEQSARVAQAIARRGQILYEARLDYTGERLPQFLADAHYIGSILVARGIEPPTAVIRSTLTKHPVTRNSRYKVRDLFSGWTLANNPIVVRRQAEVYNIKRLTVLDAQGSVHIADTRSLNHGAYLSNHSPLPSKSNPYLLSERTPIESLVLPPAEWREDAEPWSGFDIDEANLSLETLAQHLPPR